MAQSQSTMTRQVRISIHGVGYGPAAQRIEQALGMVPGVTRAAVMPGSHTAQVTCQPATQPAELLAVVNRLGFKADLLAA